MPSRQAPTPEAKAAEKGSELEALLEEAGRLKDNDPEAAIALSKQVLGLLQKPAPGERDRKQLLFEARIVLSQAESNRGNYARALEQAIKAIGETRASGNRSGLARALRQAGVVHYLQYDNQKALEFYLESYRVQEDLDDPEEFGGLLNNLGLLHLNQGDLDKALRYLKEARALDGQVDAPLLMSKTYHNLGLVYGERGEKDLALASYQKSLDLAKSLGNRMGESILLNNIGLLHQKSGDLAEAEKAYHASLAIKREIGYRPGEAATLRYLGELQLANRQLDKAQSSIEQSLRMARQIDNPGLVKECSRILSQIYEEKGDYKAALTLRKRHEALTNKLLGEKTRADIERLQAEFERARHQKEIAELRSQNQLRQMETRRQRTFFLTLASFLALLVTILLLLYYWRAQKALLAQERLTVDKLKQLDRLKNDFLANTSHELRTPINGIVGLTESLLAGAAGPLDRGVAHNLSMVAYSGRRLANLINDILDFSQLRNKDLVLDRKAVDLHAITDLVLTLTRPLIDTKDLVLLNAISESTFFADADENRLQQILYNLIGNGIKFTDSGHVKVSARMKGNRIAIRVDDTGIGIPEEHRERVFHSFEQLDGNTNRGYGGTGLGLAVTKRLVRLHGGDIEVLPKEGPGATIEFTLPVWRGEIEELPLEAKTVVTAVHRILPDDQATETPIAKIGGKDRFRILIVDDEPVNRQVLLNHLSLHDYALAEAANGPSALRAFEEGKGYDLVLLDIMMPRMSGYQVCHKLRQTHSMAELPIIFLTARNQLTNLEAGFEAGANDYVIKPVSKNEILLRVRTQLLLLQTNRELEAQVRERTAQLKEKNEALQEMNRKLEHMSSTDPLTGMGNRRYLRNFLDKDVSQILRRYTQWEKEHDDSLPPKATLNFLLIDLDHFKKVNDTHGHDAGDRVLTQMKGLMKKAAREHDLLIRWGGEEFLIVGRETEPEGATLMAERMRKIVEDHAFDIGDGQTIKRTCSIGFVSFPFWPKYPRALTWEQTLRIVDSAMYAAKNTSRNAWVGIKCTDQDPPQPIDKLLPRLFERPDQLVTEGFLQVETSIPAGRTLTWH
ncbi:Diguanylate cyclase [Sulfidibacter corallicola]|uniref:histidine kinase n=1 Tax=Sulfidibacter corallicola TaxID=2818388 RepID=A0A8A4TTC2_SULCO|nr:diguanylate cyclase [Sulfidibacter corallicola]QTD52404.1 diguanylate cyclase [Sulfidibacter corallicola]